MNIFINGKHISRFSLTPLKGTLNALTSPYDYKPLKYNENATIDGSRGIITDRKAKRRDLTIPFLMTTPSLYDLELAKDKLQKELEGKENELKVAELFTTYFLVFDGLKKYSNFDNEGKATIFLKFVEMNPKHRIDHRKTKCL